MHKLEHAEIHWEEDVGLPPLDEVAGVVLLLLTLEALLRDNGRIDPRDRTNQLVEVANHKVTLRYVLLDPPEQLQQRSWQEHVLRLRVGPTSHPLH